MASIVWPQLVLPREARQPCDHQLGSKAETCELVPGCPPLDPAVEVIVVTPEITPMKSIKLLDDKRQGTARRPDALHGTTIAAGARRFAKADAAQRSFDRDANPVWDGLKANVGQ
jgi:hypothetical protein